MQMQELGKSIDQVLSNEFDAVILEEFCSKVQSPIHFLRTSHEYNLDVAPAAVTRTIDIFAPQKVSFAKIVSGDGHEDSAQITIQDPGNQCRYKFSFNELCAVFYPEARFRITDSWKNSLAVHLGILTSDLTNLFKKEIVVSIANSDPRNPPFWEQMELVPKLSFYALSSEVLKLIVSKGVPEITVAARVGSDSPYQRFMNTDHWALLSFRIGKRQQVDIAQYTDAKRIRMKCALLDLGFLENGYGKVARIKELISIDIPSDSSKEKIEATQEDFIERVLKQIAVYLP
ncbi:MAG: hypothetical protein JSU04_10485 [Bdellovibrionales bacterium]|nr:hypothetical protein [Bdellovibrionales bacterium]